MEECTKSLELIDLEMADPNLYTTNIVQFENF